MGPSALLLFIIMSTATCLYILLALLLAHSSFLRLFRSLLVSRVAIHTALCPIITLLQSSLNSIIVSSLLSTP